jgi:hypothetical protein
MQLLAAGATLALWAIPGAGLVLLPLEYFNTHIHELFHALAAVGTGGRALEIHVFANGSGATPIATSGTGSLLLTASAGYVGAAILGGLILMLARTEKAARQILYILAAMLAVSMAVWVRGDLVGVLSGLFWIAILFAAARNLKGDNLVFAAQFLGIQQALRSFVSLYVLLNINAFSGIQNDAAIAEKATGIPRLLWALTWCAISVAWMVVAFRPSLRARSSD